MKTSHSVYRETGDCSTNPVIITPKQLSAFEIWQQEKLLEAQEKAQREAFNIEESRKIARRQKIMDDILAPIIIVFLVFVIMSPIWGPYLYTYSDRNKKIEHCVPMRHVVCQ